MITRMINFALSAFVGFLLLMPAAAKPQVKGPVSYPDLNIMNNIIRGLMQDAYGTYDRIDVYGAYIPSYGLLFVVNPPYKIDIGVHLESLDSAMERFHFTMQRFDSAMAKFDSSMAHGGSAFPRPERPPAVPHLPKKMSTDSVNNYSAGQYNAVMKFLESYADAENRLAPTQNIGIVVLADGESQGRFFSISRKDVAGYRAGGTTQDTFKREVRISAVKEEAGDNSIDIMATILDKSIGHWIPYESYLWSAPNARGVYLKGIGAFFVCRAENLYHGSQFGVAPALPDADIANLEKKAIRTLGSYGSSLRFLPEGESIYLFLSTDSFTSGKNGILISLKKKDIDSYSRNEITYETLRQRATVVQER
jgi:hypothetical protein